MIRTLGIVLAFVVGGLVYVAWSQSTPRPAFWVFFGGLVVLVIVEAVRIYREPLTPAEQGEALGRAHRVSGDGPRRHPGVQAGTRGSHRDPRRGWLHRWPRRGSDSAGAPS